MASKEKMKQILRLLIERDGFVCGICDGEIADVFEADVDHIIPRILGGEDKSENLQPAHMACNRQKSGTIYPHLKQKPACAKVDKLLRQKEAMIESIKTKGVTVKNPDKRNDKIRDDKRDFVSKAIDRKKRADEFLDKVIEKNKTKSTPPKVVPKRIPILIEQVDCDSPVRLWNEIARNGFKNLSYNIFLSHFTEYRKANGEMTPF